MRSLLNSILWLLPPCIFMGCNSTAQSPTEEGSETLTIKEAVPENIQVVTALAKEEPFIYFIEAEGRIEANRQVELFFHEPGIISEIRVGNGDQVQKGAVIAELDKTVWQLAYIRAQQELLLKQEDYALRMNEYSMYNGDTTSMTEVQKRNIEASTGLATARLQLKEATLQLENATLRAPFAGKIADLYSQENAKSPSEAFCTLYSPNDLILRVGVLETKMKALSIGIGASITILADPATSYQAKLIEINPKINENGLVKVTLSLTNSKGLFPGMSAHAQLKILSNKAVTVPKNAIVIRSGKPVVFVAENERAKWHYVTLGRENGQEVEILEGIQAGQDVIVRNNLQLAHDSPITVSSNL